MCPPPPKKKLCSWRLFDPEHIKDPPGLILAFSWYERCVPLVYSTRFSPCMTPIIAHAFKPSCKSPSRKSHVRKFSRNLEGRSYLVIVARSTWLLIMGSTSLSFSWKSPSVAHTGRLYVKVWPWHRVECAIKFTRLQIIQGCESSAELPTVTKKSYLLRKSEGNTTIRKRIQKIRIHETKKKKKKKNQQQKIETSLNPYTQCSACNTRGRMLMEWIRTSACNVH